MSKKIEFDTNKFIIIGNVKSTAKNIVKMNLDYNYKNIISGAYLLENIDYHLIKKKLYNIIESYKKSDYLEKSVEEIETIISLSKDKIKSNGLWISMKDDYKVGSMIHPTSDYIYTYLDPVYSILSSIRFNNELEKSFSNDIVNIKIHDYKTCKKKLNTKRYLYLVDKNNFIPFEKGKNLKFFSQSPAKVLDKEEIPNVYSKFKSLKLI